MNRECDEAKKDTKNHECLMMESIKFVENQQSIGLQILRDIHILALPKKLE